jgi:hypothetical protein
MKRLATLVVFIALMVSGSALAASGSTCKAYNPQDCAAVGATSNTQTVTSAAGTLPFTGFDVLLLAAGGGVLLGAGLVVRRLARQID